MSRDIFEVAYNAWIDHYKDLLDENDEDWRDNLILSRQEIEEYAMDNPDEISLPMREKIDEADQFVLDNADKMKWVYGFLDNPSMKYWWMDYETIKRKVEDIEKSVIAHRQPEKLL